MRTVKTRPVGDDRLHKRSERVIREVIWRKREE